MGKGTLFVLLCIATSTAAHPTLFIPFSNQLINNSKKFATISSSLHFLHFNPGVLIPPNRSFRIKLRSDTFKSTINADLECVAAADGGESLPPWLDFDPSNLVFSGQSPSIASSSNVSVACSDSSKSDPARDWFLLQVGARALELRDPIKPLEVMASNDVKFNASKLLEDVAIDGEPITEQDGVKMTASIKSANWLHWNSSSQYILGRAPDDLTDFSPAISIQLSDASRDVIFAPLGVTLKEPFFYSSHLPSLTFIPYQPFAFDLRQFIRSPIPTSLSIEMQVTDSSNSSLSSLLRFDNTTFKVYSTVETTPSRFKRIPYSIVVTGNGLVSGTLLFTAADPTTGFASQTSVDILPPITGAIIVSKSPPVNQQILAALAVILCVIGVLGIAFALWCFPHTRREGWRRSRLPKDSEIEDKSDGIQEEIGIGENGRISTGTGDGVDEPSQQSRSPASRFLHRSANLAASTGEGSIGPTLTLGISTSQEASTKEQPRRGTATDTSTSAGNVDTRTDQSDVQLPSHPRRLSYDQRTPDSSVPRRHPLMKIARAISPGLLRDSVNRIRSATPGSNSSPRYDLSAWAREEPSDSSVDTAKADLYAMIRQPAEEEEIPETDTDPRQTVSVSSTSLREVSRGIHGLPDNLPRHPLGSYWSPSPYESFQPPSSSSPDRRSQDYRNMTAAELSARLEQSSRDLSLGDLQSPPLQYTGYRGAFVPASDPSMPEERDLGDFPSSLDSPFGLSSWPMQTRSRRISTSYSQGRFPLGRDAYESSPDASFQVVANISREESREFHLSPRWDFSLCPLPTESQEGNVGRSLTDSYSPTHLQPPSDCSRDDSKNWEY
ncbi:hypothetical protein FRB90_011753 [Tulasnella sp. 427]|nr:hypothetical protein FRB90_011753 [Tulasnella sp. 427]